MKKCFAGGLLGIALGLFATTASATLIRFDAENNANPNICSNNADGSGAMAACGNWAYINQAYGDSSAVNVTYKDVQGMAANNGALTTLRWWFDGYNELKNVAFAYQNGDGDSWARIEIDPLQGQGVQLNSFDIGAWPFTQRSSRYVRVLDLVTGSVLYEVDDVLIGVNDHSNHFSPNVFSANGVAIEWRASAYNNGIDNICFNGACVDQFGQAPNTTGVPEPGTLALLGLGVIAAAGARRRQVRRG